MKYLAFTVSRVKSITFYKFNFYSKLANSLIMFVIQYCLWKSIYSNKSVLGQLTFSNMFTYLIFAHILIRFLGGGIEKEVGEKFKSGATAIDLVKPINIVVKDLFYDLGRGSIEAFSVGIPLLILLLINHNIVSITFSKIIIFCVMSIFSFIIFFLISYIFGFISFWTNSIIGVAALKTALWGILSGSVIPLDFYPEWLLKIVNALPFKLTCYEPVAVWIKDYDFNHIIWNLSLQITWVVVLSFSVSVLKRFALTRYVAQGG